MNKSDLITAVANSTGLSKTQATEMVDLTLGAIVEALQAGDDVRLRGFGAFSLSPRPLRAGRNPRTGESISIPAVKVPTFKAAKLLREIVNGYGGGVRVSRDDVGTMAFHGKSTTSPLPRRRRSLHGKPTSKPVPTRQGKPPTR